MNSPSEINKSHYVDFLVVVSREELLLVEHFDGMNLYKGLVSMQRSEIVWINCGIFQTNWNEFFFQIYVRGQIRFFDACCAPWVLCALRLAEP